MSGRVNAFDEGLAQVRDDATLRALAELDSLEPSRTLDRAVLEQAREAAAPRATAAPRGAASARARRSQRLASAFRWGVPAAIAAAAFCALVMPRSASRSVASHAAEQRLVERMHSASSSALATRVSTAPVDLAPSGPGNSQRRSTPKFIEASQALVRQAAWTAPSRMHPPELIESIDASTVLRSRSPPPPPPARQRRTRETSASR